MVALVLRATVLKPDFYLPQTNDMRFAQFSSRPMLDFFTSVEVLTQNRG